MATNFSELPIIDLSAIKHWDKSDVTEDIKSLAEQFRTVFETVGFAYIINHGVQFKHEQIEQLSRQFFNLDHDVKRSLAKRTFHPSNSNTYRGYFPVQENDDSYKEGFEVGPHETDVKGRGQFDKFLLLEKNVWPDEGLAPKFKQNMKLYYQQVMQLCDKLMALIAIGLQLDVDYFVKYFDETVSTLRLLHYPTRPQVNQVNGHDEVKLSCASHTDSGILTILYQVSG